MRESAATDFAVCAAVAIVCSLAVSLTAVGLRARREGAQDLERMRHVLLAAGLYDERVPVARAFARVEPRVVDLETGEYVPEEAFDPAAADVLPPAEDVAGLGKRERHVRVYLVREMGRVSRIVLPVRGRGWSMLKGFLAIDRDLATVVGFTIHEHDETAGLGAQVDDPKWKARWPGKRVYDPEGTLRLRVVRGGAGARPPYEVDGISGATITTEGLDSLVRFWFGDKGYRRYLARLAAKGVDHG